eukprot:gene11500-15405_t
MKKNQKSIHKSSIRMRILKNSLQALYHSRFIHLIITLLVSSKFILWFTKASSWTIFILSFVGSFVLPVLYLVVYLKEIIFDVLVTFNIIIGTIPDNLFSFTYYSLVDDNLILGGIPLSNSSHKTLFFDELGINAVLSINETYEYNCTTIVGKPIQISDWKRNNISYLQLSSPDFAPPSFDVLDIGAEFLNKHLSRGDKVYIHCKSGVGRSASVVIAYFIKYKLCDVHSAFVLLKMKRPCIFKRRSPQMDNLIRYYNRHSNLNHSK